MTTLATALSTGFTPAVGDFIVQATGGVAMLERRNTAGAAWALVARLERSGYIVANPVAGAEYRFMQASQETPVVQADQ